jgi:hypothetical protein
MRSVFPFLPRYAALLVRSDRGRRLGSRRRVVRAVSALVAVVAAVLAVLAPSAAAQTRECFLLPQCTSVAGPWVVFSPLGQKPIPAGTSVACPDSDRLQLPVGSDYELDGPGGPTSFIDVNVTRFMPGPGVGLITGSVAYFWGVSLSASSGAFRPHVGCIPQPRSQAALQAATAQAGATSVVRTRTMRLGPSRTVRFSHRCRPGERLVRGLAGVRFHRERPPTARELRDVTVTHRTDDHRVRARVRTGPTVGDHERVTLQILAVCAR